MQQAICPLSIVPVRKEPTDRSEQVTQWLFGETADVLERQEKWTQLRFHHDGYEGWVDNKQLAPAQDGVDMTPVRAAEQFVHVNTPSGALILPFGAVLPSYASGAFEIGRDRISFPGRVSTQLTGTPVQRLLTLKDQWMNTPYLWGGRSPFGVDCSGLTQMLFLLCGVQLPRDAYQQAGAGTPVDLIDLAATGDLAFFDNAEGHIIHVGIVLGDRRILHASGRVRIDTLDQQGIFNAEEKKYTHQLRLIKRII
ncbi:MAG: C40 family peptidase [Flavobacteriales bacterium]